MKVFTVCQYPNTIKYIPFYNDNIVRANILSVSSSFSPKKKLLKSHGMRCKGLKNHMSTTFTKSTQLTLSAQSGKTVYFSSS